ncbi:MAG TPA: NAD(P)H-dependent oxidoreductase subunit E, partial [Spirochaetia bacterium]|nr:NAD(P)H-dependent oxidoreductase subunit E [Spirochaetia bacterium]
MSTNLGNTIRAICSANGNDKKRMMSIVREVQEKFGCVSDEAIDIIARQISIPRVEVDSMVSFYSFLSRTPKGKIVIRVSNDIIDRMAGYKLIAEAFVKELGINFGETTPDGKISLENTPCIGMCDQAPAVLVNNEVITNLSTDKVREIVKTLRETGDPKKLVHRLGEGNNADPMVRSMVHNNIRKKGEVLFAFAEFKPNAALEKALAMSPVEVI